jgi:UDPglucose 6-dehydrogenase
VINVALIGCGTIGNALKVWFQKNNPKINLFINDYEKGYTDDVYTNCMDAFFINVNVLNKPSGEQDIENICKICEKIREFHKETPIWIRSTITLKTFNYLNSIFNVNYMPEFLSEKTAVQDFENNEIIYTPSNNIRYIQLLELIFNYKKGIYLTNEEAIYTKYFHNIYGALKITYFNCIHELCKENGINFKNVKLGLENTNHISKLYTDVPGHDGKYGYGGKCFPKDTIAFLNENKDSLFGKLIVNIPEINESLRK